MEHFSLDKWLQDKSRKVVTRDGRPVRIICWDRNTTYWKIIGLITSPDGSTENPFTYDINGNESDGCLHDHRNDLFFADEEEKEELSEFEKELQIIISEASHWTSDDGSVSTYCQFGDKEIKKISAQIIDLAKKELMSEISDFEIYDKGFKEGKKYALKDLPKWKKDSNNLSSLIYTLDNRGDGRIFLCRKGYAININELLNLPKEE